MPKFIPLLVPDSMNNIKKKDEKIEEPVITYINADVILVLEGFTGKTPPLLQGEDQREYTILDGTKIITPIGTLYSYTSLAEIEQKLGQDWSEKDEE